MNNSYYTYLASQPCAGCGHVPVIIHHIHGMASLKTGQVMPRSHRTKARYAAIPLCPGCHRQIHEVGEEQFFMERGRPAGWAVSLAVRYLAEWGSRSESA